MRRARIFGDELRIVENGPQINRAAAAGEQFEQFDGVGEVVENAAGDGDIEDAVGGVQVGEHVAEEKAGLAAHPEGFLGDEALQVSAGVGFNGGDAGGAEFVDQVSVGAFEWAEFEDVAAGEAAGEAHLVEAIMGPLDARVIEKRRRPGFELGAAGGGDEDHSPAKTSRAF